ncbi:hypothetical protein I5M27_00510 [Adhaeribacter sp. BT258]|uniref:Immunity protein 50 n=1 Tax=Adhaeribacter terrigena TaxID=2793070 RepID=A0ABS1BWE3_9BACT|nr:hypothetical protein [Adhaeribacter terrigena]MBK0401441.1 hypothetical protein [Adhaeribacter terrigena]
MKVNFELVENYAINFEGRHIDVHNDYDFVSFDFDIVSQILKLNWIKSDRNRITFNEILDFTLIHYEVNFLNIMPRDSKALNSDDSCLLDFTFFPSTERDINDSLMIQNLPHNLDDIIYTFAGGQIIRVNCSEIKFVTSSIKS